MRSLPPLSRPRSRVRSPDRLLSRARQLSRVRGLILLTISLATAAIHDAAHSAELPRLGALLEETSVTADFGGLVDVHDVIYRDDAGALTVHYVLTVYWGRWRGGEPSAGSDSADARFVPLPEIGRYPLTPGAAALIRRAASLGGG